MHTSKRKNPCFTNCFSVNVSDWCTKWDKLCKPDQPSARGSIVSESTCIKNGLKTRLKVVHSNRWKCSLLFLDLLKSQCINAILSQHPSVFQKFKHTSCWLLEKRLRGAIRWKSLNYNVSHPEKENHLPKQENPRVTTRRPHHNYQLLWFWIFGVLSSVQYKYAPGYIGLWGFWFTANEKK